MLFPDLCSHLTNLVHRQALSRACFLLRLSPEDKVVSLGEIMVYLFIQDYFIIVHVNYLPTDDLMPKGTLLTGDGHIR